MRGDCYRRAATHCSSFTISSPSSANNGIGGNARGRSRGAAACVSAPAGAATIGLAFLCTRIREGWAMAQVKVIVNGRSFRMGCRDGEEARVRELAAEIDGHVQRIKGGSKAIQDERLFLMAALMMADQLWDAREEVQRLQRAGGERAYQAGGGGAQAMQRELNKALESGGRS